MKRPASRRMMNLLPAAESVRYNQHIRRGLSDGRQQHAFANRHRDVEFVCVEAERAGHAAAAGVRRHHGCAHFLQYRFLICQLHERLVMAVPVKQDTAVEAWRLEPWGVMFEELAE